MHLDTIAAEVRVIRVRGCRVGVLSKVSLAIETIAAEAALHLVLALLLAITLTLTLCPDGDPEHNPLP